MALDDGTELFGTVSEVCLLPSTSTGVAAYPAVVLVTGSTEGLYDGVAVTADIVYESGTDVLTVASGAVTSVDGASVVTVLDADGNEADDTGSFAASAVALSVTGDR